MPKAADPSVDFLGERAWKAVARQKALESAEYMVGTRLMPGERRQLVDGILGTIGPFYEAAIRDAVLQFIYARLGMGAFDPEPVTGYALPLQVPDGALEDILRFLWRQVSEDEKRRLGLA